MYCALASPLQLHYEPNLQLGNSPLPRPNRGSTVTKFSFCRSVAPLGFSRTSFASRQVPAPSPSSKLDIKRTLTTYQYRADKEYLRVPMKFHVPTFKQKSGTCDSSATIWLLPADVMDRGASLHPGSAVSRVLVVWWSIRGHSERQPQIFRLRCAPLKLGVLSQSRFPRVKTPCFYSPFRYD